MTKRRLITIMGLVTLVVVAWVVFKAQPEPLHSEARRAWKEQRIAEIAARVSDPAWATNQLARLQAVESGGPKQDKEWISNQLIRLRNGEWLAYANICHKEDPRIHDLFLARGSDGRWYYSTYHFCKDMIVLRMEDQPADLAGFVHAYFLRTFDGKSDDCLQKTWPVEGK